MVVNYNSNNCIRLGMAIIIMIGWVGKQIEVIVIIVVDNKYRGLHQYYNLININHNNNIINNNNKHKH